MHQENYESIKAETLAALGNGDAHAAFRTFRPVLQIEGGYCETTEGFVDAFTIFARIAEQFADEEFVSRVRDAASAPNDVQRLYDLAYSLYEEALFRIAANVLTRADQLAPGTPAIVSELVCALEGANMSDRAVNVLRTNPDLCREQFLFAYLLAFNSLMSCDLAACREVARTLPTLEKEPDHGVMTQRITEFLQRATQIESVSALDISDLRGWHYVVTGGVLTMLSPFGFPEPMAGRYAYVQDCYNKCRVGLARLKMILQANEISPTRVYALPDRSSKILAIAAGQLFDASVEDWPEGGTDQPGVFVAYDISSVPHEVLKTLVDHRSQQLLYSHALCWTQTLPITPDVTSVLYQTLVEPWGERMRMDPDSDKPIQIPADGRSEAELASEILSASADEQLGGGDEGQCVEPLSESFVRGMGVFPPAHGARGQAWENSPVKSARFD